MNINIGDVLSKIYCKIFCYKTNEMPSNPRPSKPARYWILTIPHSDFTPFLPVGVSWIRGQLEVGSNTEYCHWQICVYTSSKCRLSAIKNIFGERIHAEPTRSEAAEAYVFKEDTRVDGTQFELGEKPFRRNNAKDWERVWEMAKSGRINEIPADIRVSNYRTLKQIEKDYLMPTAQEKTVYVFWGRTGTGKSKRAWEEATYNAYPKDPNTKFWDGYQGQENVVIDEFRGKIDISHMLRWLDRYPVIVECKFGAVSFAAKKIWITSNKNPRDWYPELDAETVDALIRRMEITEFAL